MTQKEVKTLYTKYEADGKVLGKLWGGGLGGYPARDYTNDNKEALIKEIEKDFKSGGLDSGMGFESLVAAVMTITTVECVEIDGKKYVSRDFEEITFGDAKYVNELLEIM